MTSLTADDSAAAASVASVAQPLLKTDVLGRGQIPRERREALLEEFERSGISAAQFARLAGIKYSTFAQWVQKHRRRRPGSQSDRSLRLVQAVVTCYRFNWCHKICRTGVRAV